MSEMNEQSETLYQKRIPIYPRSVKGKFRTFKTSVLILAYAVYFMLPWLPWSRGSADNQAIMFDLVSRRFFIFDLVIYPQDIFLLSLLLFISAAFLFFVTGLIGRAWCGYFCFQTLWLDCFLLIENLFQGERPARIRLAKQPWNAEKILKVGGSHAAMVMISFWTGFTFAAYFSYAPHFFIDFFSGQANTVAYFAVFLLTATTYIAGGVIREQVCTYFCPYARFQGVMYENDTLAPAYDYQRGEGTTGRILPTKGLKTKEERAQQGHGDCIDCGFCVQVCPTGVDIRKGMQYQCISCGLCIDACDTIMDSLGWERGLIRYDSELNLSKPTPEKPKIVWKQMKVILNAIALIVMVSILFYRIATRSDVEVVVEQVRQPLYINLSDDSVRNRYMIHIVNKTELEKTFHISVQGIPEHSLNLNAVSEVVTIAPGKGLRLSAKVDLDEDLADKTTAFEFIITPENKPDNKVVRKVSFYSKHQGKD